MIDVLRMINIEKNKIDQQLAQEDERLAFYETIFSKNNCSNLKEVLKCNSSDLAAIVIMHYSPHLTVSDIKRVVYSHREIFENYTEEEVQDFIHMMGGFDNDKELYESVKQQVLKHTDPRINQLFSEAGRISILLRQLIDALETTPSDFFAFTDMFLEEHTTFIKAIATASTLRQIAAEQDSRYEFMDLFSGESFAKGILKHKDKWVETSLNYEYNIPNILEPILNAHREYSSLLQARKSRDKALTKDKKNYENLETTLYKSIQAGEIRNIEALIRKVPSDEVKMAILKLIYSHNQEIYTQLSEEYKKLAANDASHYRVLLAKYGISPETYEVGTVMENSLEDLEKMLTILTVLQFTTSHELLAIIQNSNLETVGNIKELVERGIITTHLMVEYPTIFSPNSKDYEDFMRNLAFISKKKLNPHYFTESEETLVLPHQRFTENIKVLEDYALLPNVKTGMNLNFLEAVDLPNAIDTLLELGYEKNLEECIELLNHKDKFERLKVLKILNIPVTDTATLLDVLTTDKFYIPDSEIPNYIYNAASYHLPSCIVEVTESKKKAADLTRLSQFENTSRTYSFNDVLISKNKVHRNLSNIVSTGKPTERLLYGVLKDSTLTDAEVIKVVACIAPTKVKEKNKNSN